MRYQAHTPHKQYTLFLKKKVSRLKIGKKTAGSFARRKYMKYVLNNQRPKNFLGSL